MTKEMTRLAIFREYLGINQSELSKKLGIHQRNWSRYENGDVNPPEDVLIKLAAEGLNLHWLHTGEGCMTLDRDRKESFPFDRSVLPGKKKETFPVYVSDRFDGNLYSGIVIPLLDQAVSAGNGKDINDDESQNRFVKVPRELSKYHDLRALPVVGDSMAPTLNEGDIVVCDSCVWCGDGIYVIKTHEFAFVKRVIRTAKGYTVVSDNKAYPPYSESTEDIQIVGKVRCAVIKIE